jgi:hypothetical protein
MTYYDALKSQHATLTCTTADKLSSIDAIAAASPRQPALIGFGDDAAVELN